MAITGVSDLYSSLGLTSAQEETETKKALGQEDFLALLTTQLQYQDPFKPLDNTEFVAQMASFSQLDSLQSLQSSFDSLASSLTSNQALQASSLVGKVVSVPTDTAYLFYEGGMLGQTELSGNADRVVLEVRDASGALVRTLDMGAQQAGDVELWWDGLDESGNRLPEGQYQFAVFATQGNRTEQLATDMRVLVSSVNLSGGTGEIVLNLAGLGSVPLSQVTEIGG
jgi:flagellar basal-body rod modification protein FlgD